MISTSEKDFLDNDQKIRGQNFTCVSFLSPETILKKKDVFYFEKFLESFSKSLTQLFDEVEEHYPDKSEQIRIFKEAHCVYFEPKEIHSNFTSFVSNSVEKLDEEFGAENDFQTNVRGLKIRGTYDTLEEAKHRADVLRKNDDEKFSIYIAEVGCWVPWNPNPDQVGDQEFAETELNTLMKNYVENSENKNALFNERKIDLMKKIEEGNVELKTKNETIIEEDMDDVETMVGIDEKSEDHWLANKDHVKEA